MSRFIYHRLPEKKFPLDSVAEAFRKLCRDDAAAGMPNDASGFLLAVQTAEAKRLLSERIAREFAPEGGVFGLNLLTPASLFRPPEPSPANDMEVLSAWLRVFDEIDFADFPDLLPNPESFDANLKWRFGLAESLQRLRLELAAEACPVREVAARLNEAARKQGGEEMWNKSAQWEQLTRLEEIYLRRFSAERPDPAAFQLDSIERPWLPSGVRGIVFALCPNPLPAAMAAAKRLPDDVRVHILLSGAEDEDAFDVWGRPDPDYWKKKILSIPDSAFHKFLKPEDQARKILAIYPKQDAEKPAAIGVLDPEILDAVDEAQRLSGGKDFYLPRQLTLKELPLTRLFSALADFMNDDPSFDATAALFRDPAVVAVLSPAGNGACGDGEILSLLDRLQKSAILETFSGLRREVARRRKSGGARKNELAALERLDAMLQVLDGWRRMRKDGLLDALVSVFSEIAARIPAHRYRKFDEEALAVFRKAVRDARALADVSDEMRLQLIRRELDRTTLPDRINPDAKTDLCGFLELPWRTDVPLLIAGCNEEMFDGGVQDDAFLPDRVRTLLGFRDRAFYFGVSVFQMNLLIQPRPAGGVVFFFGASSSSGDPLKPARAFFQTTDEELPARAELLFGNACMEETTGAVSPGKRETTYLIRKAPKRAEAVMSITGFKAYLQCPFRYYFDRILGSEILEDRNMELDDLDYGNLAHEALRRLCRDNEARRLEPDSIDFLLGRLFERIETGGRSGIPYLQRELIASSLRSFARIQLEELAAGWRVVLLEAACDFPWSELYQRSFPDEPAESWRARIRIKGRIDRIDRHPERGWRILDYKTSKKGEPPDATHWAKRRSVAPEEEWKRVAGTDSCVWTDLQLPLYVAALAAGFVRGAAPGANEPIQAGYFNLPLAFSETGIKLFDDLFSDPLRLASAIRTADEILRRAFLNPVFEPPSLPSLLDPLYQMIGNYRKEGVLRIPHFERGELYDL